jgi:hypothetical protein
MRKQIVFVAPWLAAAAIGAALALSASAAADTNPAVPYGGDNSANSPAMHRDPSTFGVHSDDHDEIDQSAGSFDVPF